MRAFVQVIVLFNGILLAAARPQDITPQAGKPVPGHYIVVLKEDISTKGFEAHQNWTTKKCAGRIGPQGGSANGIRKSFNLAKFKAYAGAFDAQTIKEIKNNEDVAFVEQDSWARGGDATPVAIPPATPVVQGHETGGEAIVTQSSVPSWGIARISQRNSPDLSKYYYDSAAGQGTTAYVLDTGVRLSHSEFEGRASFGKNFSPNGDNDVYGHGSHVAGIIAGKNYGVAKKANIISVKILDDKNFGLWSDIIAGIQWTVQDARNRGISTKAIANLSIWGGRTDAANAAVKAAVDSGLTMVLIAGNGNDDASTHSPGSEPSVLTVAATDKSDSKASYSSYGSVVDIYAPGSDINSAAPSSDSASQVMSGTSMAAPHVAGVALYLMSFEGARGPAAIANRISQLAQGVVKNPGSGTTNKLLYNGAH